MITLWIAWAAAQDTYVPGTQPPPPPREEAVTVAVPRREPWTEARKTIVSGSTLIVVGTGLGIGTFMAASDDTDAYSAGALQSMNVAAWTLAGCGLALVSVGVGHGLTTPKSRARRASLRANPTGLTVAGEF